LLADDPILSSEIEELTETDQALENWLVLLEILLQWEESNEDWENIGDGDLVWVSHDKTADTSSSVVGGSRILSLEKRLKLPENLVETWEVCRSVGGVGNQETNGIGSIGSRLDVLVRESVEEKLEKSCGVRGNSGAHVVGALSNDTDGCGAFVVLVSGGKLHHWLLEQLPDLNKLRSKSLCKANNDIQSSVDNEPVILRGLLKVFIAFISKIKLTWVRLGDNGSQNSCDLLNHVFMSQNSWATKLKCCREVSVDVSDNSSVIWLA
jgi:hypothetical protein